MRRRLDSIEARIALSALLVAVVAMSVLGLGVLLVVGFGRMLLPAKCLTAGTFAIFPIRFALVALRPW